MNPPQPDAPSPTPDCPAAPGFSITEQRAEVLARLRQRLDERDQYGPSCGNQAAIDAERELLSNLGVPRREQP